MKLPFDIPGGRADSLPSDGSNRIPGHQFHWRNVVFRPLFQGTANRALLASFWAAAVLCASWAGARPVASVEPVLEFVSASLTSGPGREPPPGAVLRAPELVGVIRVRGFDTRRSALRLTLVAPSENGRPPRLTRVNPTSWARPDPKDKSLIRWTCKWPGAASAEGWSVKIEALRTRPRMVVSGSVQHLFLPVPPRPLAPE